MGRYPQPGTRSNSGEASLSPRKMGFGSSMEFVLVPIYRHRVRIISPARVFILPWNTFIGEGLVDYGFRAEAAELVTRLMNAIVLNLKRDKAFRRYYHSQTGAGIGERDALVGLAPLGLFLYTLGVKLLSPTRVEIAGTNPFPWPVTVKYRGLTILRQNEKTTIIFPDGQAVTLDGSESRIVALE